MNLLTSILYLELYCGDGKFEKRTIISFHAIEVRSIVIRMTNTTTFELGPYVRVALVLPVGLTNFSVEANATDGGYVRQMNTYSRNDHVHHNCRRLAEIHDRCKGNAEVRSEGRNVRKKNERVGAASFTSHMYFSRNFRKIFWEIPKKK